MAAGVDLMLRLVALHSIPSPVTKLVLDPSTAIFRATAPSWNVMYASNPAVHRGGRARAREGAEDGEDGEEREQLRDIKYPGVTFEVGCSSSTVQA